MLSLRGVTYRYPGASSPSLLDVDIELAEGSVVGVVGPSEAGKSTLCLALGGIAPRVTGGTLEGVLLLDGTDVASRSMGDLVPDVVTGFQDPASQLSMVADTVFEEIAFGPANLGLGRAELISRVERSLAEMGLEDLAARDPRNLSGGQQQLVAIAGLLAMRPRYLILDEPTAHLDARGAGLVAEAISTLSAEGTAVLLVEQETSLLERVCTTVVAMDGGQIVARGAASVVLSDPAVLAIGVREPEARRLEHLVSEHGRVLGDRPTLPGGPG